MIQIRKGVFETNSSSCHSLCLSKKEGRDTYLPLKDGEWKISKRGDMTFDRYPFRILNTFESKCRYAIASEWEDDKRKEIFKIIRKINPEFKKFVYYHDNYGKDKGYVDGSNIYYWLDRYNITLEEFLTDNKYVVICDSDDPPIFNYLWKSNIVDKDKIDYKEW